MQIIANVGKQEVQDVELVNLSSIERRCSECNVLFDADEEIYVFVPTSITPGFSIPIPDNIFILHAGVSPSGKCCLEDFMDRFVTRLATPTQIPSPTTELPPALPNN